LVSETQVNIQAREERHAKLKEQNISPKTTPQGRRASYFTDFFNPAKKFLFNGDINNPLLWKWWRQVATILLAFLLIMPLISSYQLTQGAFIGVLDETEGDMTGLEPIEGDMENTIQQVITEDGFLLKPNINTTLGDRTGFSDIFMYTVESGDSLSSIAERFNLRKDTIMAENDLWNPNQIKSGVQIKILPVDGLSYSVKKGDTVEKIAKKMKADKETIMKQNRLDSDSLEEDMVIIVPGATRSEPVYLARQPNAPDYVPNFGGAKGSGRLMWPVSTGGKITQSYHRRHTAIDIGNPARGPIYAAAGGKVVKAKYGWNGGYGNVIIIDHGNGMQTLYGHNEKLYVTEGQYVDQGQTISWMGNSGRVYGPTGIHLHFEVRINGVKYNPMNFF